MINGIAPKPKGTQRRMFRHALHIASITLAFLVNSPSSPALASDYSAAELSRLFDIHINCQLTRTPGDRIYLVGDYAVITTKPVPGQLRTFKIRYRGSGCEYQMHGERALGELETLQDRYDTFPADLPILGPHSKLFRVTAAFIEMEKLTDSNVYAFTIKALDPTNRPYEATVEATFHKGKIIGASTFEMNAQAEWKERMLDVTPLPE